MALPFSILTFHRDPERHRYFSDRGGHPALFDPTTNAWVITDPGQCRQLISSDKLRPASYIEDYAALNERLGLDFSALTFAFNHIPLCLHGDRHSQSRRRASEFLAARKPALTGRLPDMIARHFAALRHRGHYELMNEVISPFVHEFISAIVDIDADAIGPHNPSQIFDRSVGINKRRRMEADIISLRELITSRVGKNATEEEIGLRLAFLILGTDPLMGMLGESLHSLLKDNPGRLLAELAYPELPPETGVPFIERLVVTPFELAGRNFLEGERVRIFLQSFAYADDPATRTNFFGGGAHACLGRPLSIEIWKGIVAFLSRVPLRANVLSYSPRTSDYVFSCPEYLCVELRE